MTMMIMCRRRVLLSSICLLLLLLSCNPTSALSAKPPPTYKKKVVIVGGGPVGLATALTLSNPPHCMNVTLVEQSTPSDYDPTKACLFMLNSRGQTWTERFPVVQKRLEERGSVATAGFGRFVIVPSDPQKEIPPPTKLSMSNKEITRQSYWIPRHVMTSLLEETLRDEQQAREKDGNRDSGSVHLCFGTKFLSLETEQDGMIKVTVQHAADPTVTHQETFSANLVVAADGVNSGVREFLADEEAKPLKTNWLTENPRKFRMHKWTLPSSGLRMKVLQFPPGFPIPNPDGTLLKTESEVVYAIRSNKTGPRTYLSLGLLPVKDPNMVRPTNVVTRPNHEIWKLKSGSEIREWFTRAFPRLDMDEMIDKKEWECFAQAEGTTFPKCQYCGSLQVSSPDGSAGVVLVGDATHIFPPDIGQGVSSGVLDVDALVRDLQGKNLLTNEPSETGDALKEYERVRAPEIAALIRFASFGSPYQYRQPLYEDRIGRFLWSFGVGFPLILNKLSGGLIPPGAMMMAQDKNLTFRQVMRRADLTAAGVTAAVAAILWRIRQAKPVLGDTQHFNLESYFSCVQEDDACIITRY